MLEGGNGSSETLSNFLKVKQLGGDECGTKLSLISQLVSLAMTLTSSGGEVILGILLFIIANGSTSSKEAFCQ